jgi:drug/metabolite transporter (DMT)-like permease
MPAHLLGVLAALTSAATWGGGDFAGGLASRRSSQFQVLAMAALSGVVVLIPLAIAWREPIPRIDSIAWAALAGLSGAVGITALYRALSLGNAAIVSPTAGVISAGVPVVLGAFLEGIAGYPQLAGIVTGMAGIWLVSRAAPSEGANSRRDLGLAILAGLGFGGFFVFIAQVQPGLVLTPVVTAKVVSLIAAAAILLARRLPFPSPAGNPVALIAGVLDASGNVFYLLAKQFTRMDVAAVMSSMYPAATVILARAVLGQPVSRTQWLGVVLCVCGVGLIAL